MVETQKKVQKRHNSRVVKIRNTSGLSSALNTAHVHKYGPRSYTSRVIFMDFPTLNSLQFKPKLFSFLIRARRF